MGGISAIGAYIPRLRLSRKLMTDANAWFNPALKAFGKRLRRHEHSKNEQSEGGKAH